MTSAKPLTFIFKDDGKVPNNPALPVLVYKGAVDVDSKRDPASAIEKLFAANGWGRDQWRDGIYPFVHYHAMIHEALGIARGRARVQARRTWRRGIRASRRRCCRIASGHGTPAAFRQ